MDEAGIQPAQNASVAQTGFVVHAKIEKLFTCGSAFRQPWFLIPLFALAGCFLTLCSHFSLDLFAKWACRRSCFLQHALYHCRRRSRAKRWESGYFILSVAMVNISCLIVLTRSSGKIFIPSADHFSRIPRNTETRMVIK